MGLLQEGKTQPQSQILFYQMDFVLSVKGWATPVDIAYC